MYLNNCGLTNSNALSKLTQIYNVVIPAQAGIQFNQYVLDSCFRRNDGKV